MSKLPKQIQDYLNQRGITNSVVESSLLDFENGRITIPVFDKERNLLFSKHRKDPFCGLPDVPKYTYDHGAKAVLFNTHTIDDRELPVIITEGELDALCLTSLGLQAISGTGGSGTFHNEWAKDLEGLNLLVCYDRDPAGIRGMIRVQRVLPQAKMIFLPEFVGKDITDYMLQFNRTQFLGLPAETWVIPEPDRTGSKTKQIKTYNDIANRALAYEKAHPEFMFYTQFIIEQVLAYREEIKRFNKNVLIIPHTGTNRDKLIIAKEYPIENLLEFNRAGFTRCLWHTENSASMKYYRKDNKVHCFGGCGRQWDAIDVVKKLKNLSTAEAIKYLNPHV